MTAHFVGLRQACRRLRELEEAISAQRKLIAAESIGCDAAAERAHLGRLLSDLDEMLAECNLVRQQQAVPSAREGSPHAHEG